MICAAQIKYLPYLCFVLYHFCLFCIMGNLFIALLSRIKILLILIDFYQYIRLTHHRSKIISNCVNTTKFYVKYQNIWKLSDFYHFMVLNSYASRKAPILSCIQVCYKYLFDTLNFLDLKQRTASRKNVFEIHLNF